MNMYSCCLLELATLSYHARGGWHALHAYICCTPKGFAPSGSKAHIFLCVMLPNLFYCHLESLKGVCKAEFKFLYTNDNANTSSILWASGNRWDQFVWSGCGLQRKTTSHLTALAIFPPNVPAVALVLTKIINNICATGTSETERTLLPRHFISTRC